MRGQASNSRSQIGMGTLATGCLGSPRSHCLVNQEAQTLTLQKELIWGSASATVQQRELEQGLCL